MNSKSSTFALENGLDLRQVVTTGSVLHIDLDYDETDCLTISDQRQTKPIDHIGSPVKNFEEFGKTLVPVDKDAFVRKKIFEEGGGLPLHEGCTVSVVFSGYWENDLEPFDTTCHKPLIVDLKENGLLPGLQIAINSMLVGEMSVFLLSYEVMYGEMGIPPRIKPKANCVFYIKLLKSILTPKEGKLDFSESNIFKRVYREVKMLYMSGVTLHKTNNIPAAIQVFKKAVSMLHKCRLADENEEAIQENLLIKLYTNLAICYNKTKQPLKACVACNELNRLNKLWNNGKVLFQNAKALRMIGQFDSAEKRLRRAMKLWPDSLDIENELILLQRARDSCNQTKLIVNKTITPHVGLISDGFKNEVDILLKNFKENPDLCKLTLPEGLNSVEVAYIKEACIRENLFFNKIKKISQENNDGENYALEKDDDKSSSENDGMVNSDNIQTYCV